MNDIPTLAPAPRLQSPVAPAEVSRRHSVPTSLRSLIATWRWRIRVRKELEEKSTNNPHLIDDIGLTRREVEAEIAKPFWRG